MAAAARRTLVLAPEPVHHVAGVSSVAAAQAEVGGSADGHVADGALEGETLADGALRPAGLAAAVAAEHPELCGERHQEQRFRTALRTPPVLDRSRGETYRCLCAVLEGWR